MQNIHGTYEKLTSHIGIIHSYANIGVLASGSSIYLIDSGGSKDMAEEIYATVKEVFPKKKIKAVLNTHSHADHIGGNRFFADETGAEIWATRDAQKSIEYPEMQSELIWGAKPLSRTLTQFYKADATRVSRFLDREPTAFESIGVKTVLLPGHYADEAGFLVCDTKENKTVFFLGDAMFGLEMLKKYWIPFMTDPELFRNSVERIENTAADFYVPSHGSVCTQQNIHELAEINKMVTLETETLILRELKKNRLTPEELLKRVADYAGLNLNLGQYLLIGSTLRSFLTSMDNRNLVSYEIKDNKMFWFAK